MSKKEKKIQDEEIRKLVIERLKASSSDSIKSIGSKGIYTKDELLQHVEAGDDVGKTIQKVEMEWLKAIIDGRIYESYE